VNKHHADLLGTAEWAALGERFAGTNVEATAGDATTLPHEAESFDTVGMFTMLHHFHEGDTYNPVVPAAFLTRLQTIGFSEVMIIAGDRLLFRARKEQAT
jgi:hypothetical protein